MVILLISKCGPEQLAHAGTSFDPAASNCGARTICGDPADLLVGAGPAGGGQRRRALHALRALFSMTPNTNYFQPAYEKNE